MTWSDFYLICFAVGFCFSFFSFVFGSSRFGKLHLPHFHGHGLGHLPTVPAPGLAANAAMTASARLTASAVGVNTSLITATWAG